MSAFFSSALSGKPNGTFSRQKPCRLLKTSARPVRLSTKRVPVRAAGDSSGSNGGSKWNWNPFGKNSKKQEAAKKALRDVMDDKKDVLAKFDQSGGDGGGGGNDGDSWGSSWDDWKDGFGEVIQTIFRAISGAGSFFKSFFFLAVGVACIGLYLPFMDATWNLIRVALRLEKAEEVYGSADKRPAGAQRSVLFSDDEDEATRIEKELVEASKKSEARPKEGKVTRK